MRLATAFREPETFRRSRCSHLRFALPGPGFHLAFNASTHAVVDAFHSEALRAGGTDNGRPGLRLQYGPTYYAAFVIDPDGYPIEAVCQMKNT